MINTKILAHEFDFVSPASLKEALDLLNEHGGETKVIAGGTDMVVMMKQETVSPELLISIRKIPELRVIKDDGALHLGSTVRLCDALNHVKKDGRFAALSDALSKLAEVQVRNIGTIGGNICNASPAADSAPPLLVFGSHVKLASSDGERTIPLDEFFQGVNKTALAGNELLMEITVPFPEKGTGSAFMKTTRVGADISKISCAILVERVNEICKSCRIAYGSVAPLPIRIKPVEDFLKDKKVDEALLIDAGNQVSEAIKPIDDIRSTAEYRKEISKVIFQDVFMKAWDRAGR